MSGKKEPILVDGVWELICTTDTLLAEIRDPSLWRLDVAKTYALALRSSAKTDWAKVNRAIIDRWSGSALQWIKERAHSGRAFA